jgi:hypothetical protein
MLLGVATWFRSHDRTISITGLFIVFATYVVKDGMRDSLKDLTSTIGNAQTAFAINAEQDTALQALYRLENKIEGPQNPSDYQKFLGQNALRAAQEMEINITNIERLRRELGPKFTSEAFEWNTKAQHLKVTAQELEYISGVTGPDATSGMREQLSSKQKQFDNEYTELADYIAETNRGVFYWAEIDRAKYEHLFRIVTRLSYFLFAIGWALTFISTLLGRGPNSLQVEAAGSEV